MCYRPNKKHTFLLLPSWNQLRDETMERQMEINISVLLLRVRWRMEDVALKLRSSGLVNSSLQNWTYPPRHRQWWTTHGSPVAESTPDGTLCKEKGRKGWATCVQFLPNSEIRSLTLPLLGTSVERGQEWRTADVPPHGNMGISKCNRLMSFLALKLYSIL